MAVEQRVLDWTFKNTSGGSIAQFSPVSYDITNAFGAVQPGNANAGPLIGVSQSRGVDGTGVLQNSAQNGDPLIVRIIGVTRVYANAATTIGVPLYIKTVQGNGTNNGSGAPSFSGVGPYFSALDNTTGPTGAGYAAGFLGFGLEAGTTQGDVVSMLLAAAFQPALKKLGSVAAPLTANAVANTQSSFAHGLGYAPVIVILQSAGATPTGVLGESQAADATNIYMKSTVASSTFEAYVA